MEDKVRVYEIAEEAGASSAEVISKAADLGLTTNLHKLLSHLMMLKR